MARDSIRRSRETSRLQHLQELMRVQFAHIRREIRGVHRAAEENLEKQAEHGHKLVELETRLEQLEARHGGDSKGHASLKAITAIVTGLTAAAVYLWEKFK